MLREVPIAQVPDELLHNLNPTGYCESDKLSQVAQSMFGQLPKGLSRVQAIVGGSIKISPIKSVDRCLHHGERRAG